VFELGQDGVADVGGGDPPGELHRLGLVVGLIVVAELEEAVEPSGGYSEYRGELAPDPRLRIGAARLPPADGRPIHPDPVGKVLLGQAGRAPCPRRARLLGMGPGYAGQRGAEGRMRPRCRIGALVGAGPRGWDQVMCPIVELIAGQPGLADRLLAAHVDDGTGRFRVCSGGGQTGWMAWPCQLHDYASRARAAQRAGDERPR
jgi:hypothetical protein